MSGPARTGVLFYAKNLASVSAFYERIPGARVIHAEEEHRVLQSPDVRLIIYAIPPQYASGIVGAVPPAPREEQVIKAFFTVESLAITEPLVEQLGAGSAALSGQAQA